MIVAPTVALIVPGTNVVSFIRIVHDVTHEILPGDSFWQGISGAQKNGLLLRCAPSKAETTNGYVAAATISTAIPT